MLQVSFRRNFGDSPGGDGGFVLVLVLKLLGGVELAVEIDGWGLDVVEAFGAEVDEFRDVDGAVGGGGIFDDDGWAGVALIVDLVARIRVATQAG